MLSQQLKFAITTIISYSWPIGIHRLIKQTLFCISNLTLLLHFPISSFSDEFRCLYAKYIAATIVTMTRTMTRITITALVTVTEMTAKKENHCKAYSMYILVKP